MLMLETKEVTVEPDGRGAPTLRLVSGGRRCRTGVAGHLGQSRPETGPLMLCRTGPQAYSILGSAPAGSRSGECRLKAGAGSPACYLAQFRRPYR
jgi:hypothetical protein